MNRPLNRQEAVLYGQIVEACYTMYGRDHTILQPEPAAGDIPEPYELVAWVNMSDFILGNEMPKFYGIVVRHKMQKHNFILAIRGTEGLVEWLDDAFVHLVPFRPVPNAGRVSFGFDKIYSTLQVLRRHRGPDGTFAPKAVREPDSAREPMTGTFARQLEQLTEVLEGPAPAAQGAPIAKSPKSFVVTGHSLGASLSTLYVMENKERNTINISTSCTFASPHTGNKEFARTFDLLPLDSWRIVNTQDLVPKLPIPIPVFLDYDHVETAYPFSSAGTVKYNPICWHSMKTYLHWLDPTLALDPGCVL
jgi:triacylglycerol lipase